MENTPLRFKFTAFALFFCLSISVLSTSHAASLYIPMNKTQTDHLKAYGVVFKALQGGQKAQWLLNYEGGSFLIDYSPEIETQCLLRGVSCQKIGQGEEADIYRKIEVENMERVELEKPP